MNWNRSVFWVKSWKSLKLKLNSFNGIYLLKSWGHMIQCQLSKVAGRLFLSVPGDFSPFLTGNTYIHNLFCTTYWVALHKNKNKVKVDCPLELCSLKNKFDIWKWTTIIFELKMELKFITLFLLVACLDHSWSVDEYSYGMFNVITLKVSM